MFLDTDTFNKQYLILYKTKTVCAKPKKLWWNSANLQMDVIRHFTLSPYV